MKNLIIPSLLILLLSCNAWPQSIPSVLDNIKIDENQKVYFEFNDRKVYAADRYFLRYDQIKGNPQGTEEGIFLDFNDSTFEGRINYGFIPKGDSRYPHPIYRASTPITAGKAAINIRDRLSGIYDAVGWQESGKGTIGYRVVSAGGTILYDGVVSFKGKGPFEVDDTIIEGPFVSKVTDQTATIWFRTNRMVKASIQVNETKYKSKKGTYHEIDIKNLEQSTEYDYTVNYGDNNLTYSFKTSPKPGSRTSFTFAYASDSRSGIGGGERDVYGANFYIMKKILALTRFKGASFMQFSGDLINGYLTTPEEIRIQYANWKRAVEPWGHYLPVYISMGNHEALVTEFSGNNIRVQVDRFPYKTHSAETVFAGEFANPENGPQSEDGADYDPDPGNMDFPAYRENVFYYTYDNIGVIVLNSDYWYTPTTRMISSIGGGLHGYIMDKQLEWLAGTLEEFENDENIDHVFVTQHTPIFPNGGHVGDDMWYRGNNQFRPWVAGRPLAKGIIERRDQILDLIVNKSQKVIAVLTGDEHNYARTEVGPDTEIYPEVYHPSRIQLNRTIHQINNGAAGAPYYSQEETPWTPFVSGFTTQHALVFFHIEGESIEMEVLNPDTLEEVDRLKLR